MRRDIGRWRALANATFVLAVLALGGYGLFQVASRRWHVQPTFHVRVAFPTIAGLEAGHRVRIQGMDAGVVEQVVPPAQPGAPVELTLRLDERLRPLLRTDAVARILSEGMVGARVVEITPGKPDAPPVGQEGAILSEPPVEIGDLVRQTGASLRKLDDLARTARIGLEEINALAAAIREGKGSLGKLVHDDDAYQSLMSMTHRGERTFSALEDNLTALKRTWPISRYFDSRSYYERERVLYQPGARKDARIFRAEDLFEPGGAILTPVGRTRLDGVGSWFKQSVQPKSEVVIAAFTDEGRDTELAEVLTQEQADAVRNYLVHKHGIDSAGWFRSRKVAAVGFGTQVPRLPNSNAEAASLPPRRVDIILFTPQT
jgi:phospholipid/cholesterol/gamma-HCH transport system substrate-binding protein